MGSVIYRYTIEVHAGIQWVKMPLGYKLLSVAPGRNGYYLDLWAEVTPGLAEVKVPFDVYGTGHPMAQPSWGQRDYVGTAVMQDGLVWHVYTGGVYPGE